jgi:EmrB/QacA subfamily drug resistance transporter
MTDIAQPVSSRSVTAPSRGSSRRRGLILVVLALSQLMVILDGTIVNIALPSAEKDLGFGADQRQWVVTAYALAFGSLLLLGGRLTDLFGRKAAFIVGLAGFAAASAVAGAAGDFSMLIVGRALQGVFGALLAPAALSLLSTTFTESTERARAFGVFGAVAGAGGAIGLLLGGVLTEYTSWRWCLLVNLVIAAIAIAGAVALIPRQRAAAPRPKLDLPGTVLITLGLVGIVYGFSSAGSDGWGSALTIVPLAVGVVLAVGFVVLETRVAYPLLPMRVVLDRNRGGSYLTIALVGVALFSVFLFLAYYLQNVRGYTPFQSGVAFLPLPFAIAITSTTIAPRLVQRFGPKLPIVAGTLLGAIALLLLTGIGITSNYWLTIPPALVILGLGMGCVFASTFDAATAGVTSEDAGVASAMVNTAQQIGGAVGTALLSAIAQGALTGYLADNGTDELAQTNAQLASYHAAFYSGAAVLVLLSTTMLFLLRNGRTACEATSVA